VAYYESEKSEILSTEFRRKTATLDSFEIVAPLYARIQEVMPTASFLQRLTFIELQLRLPELLLMRVDKMAMANSVEVRVPFLDRDLIDFALAVPLNFKLRDGVSKEPLKRLLSRHVSRQIAYRPKTGFGVPIQEWFPGQLGRELERLLDQDHQVYEEFFSLDRLVSKIRGKLPTVNCAFQLWVVYSFVLWWNAVRSEARSRVASSVV
jgi:asparagine synthase (glutamine-hydrolysing)